eukprot:TRINITY_DN7983_c0_g1_i1.p1 TRINITY_DN7983_c0_g1~~TRINITY_DN7983_c0_g1_i1.p1  ORF type:complete len:682 (+),score=213.78 TRINITY_DN7983_c0_g1_i1:47-2047(+)
MGNCSSDLAAPAPRTQHGVRKQTQRKSAPKAQAPLHKSAKQSTSFAAVREQVIGEEKVVRTDVGLLRRILYTDYTASGRAHQGIESFVHDEVLPLYANTHTVASATGKQTTLFREEARETVKRFYHCTEADAGIFVGNGATGALSMFVEMMRRTKGFGDADHQGGCSVLIDPISHHSSILPFRELAKEDNFYTSTCLRLDPTTSTLCVEHLRDELEEAQRKGHRTVCVFSGGSNVTGVQPDHAAIETLVKQFDGIVCWDLAAVAGHRRFPFSQHADFAFISPHKLLGGPGTCGVLLAKKRLLTHTTPCFVGGGCVSFVTPVDHDYVPNVEEREEAGTPNIVAGIKAGLVYRLHESLDSSMAYARELELYWRVFHQVDAHPNVRILARDQLCPREGAGADEPSRSPLPILSFNVAYLQDPATGKEMFLHYNFVTALLNDLFGVQVRGGCACAGPYGKVLMNVSDDLMVDFRTVITELHLEALKPGFVRTGTHFTMTDEDADVVAGAIKYVADKGWLFLGAYNFNENNGTWTYCGRARGSTQKRRPTLADLTELSQTNQMSAGQVTGARQRTLRQMVSDADALLDSFHGSSGLSLDCVDDDEDRIPAKAQHLMWFARPRDFVAALAPHARNGVVENLSSLKVQRNVAKQQQLPSPTSTDTSANHPYGS